MKHLQALVLEAALTAALIPGGASGAERACESLNLGWLFERYGSMPDGSSRPEPGAACWAITASAFSEERGKGNRADLAFDGDADTCWRGGEAMAAAGFRRGVAPRRRGGGICMTSASSTAGYFRSRRLMGAAPASCLPVGRVCGRNMT